MALTKRKSKLVASRSAYLAPLSCDSTISYKIIDGSRRVSGNVQLSDCNRKIEWYFGGEDDPIAKADKAILLLQEFRESFAKAVAERKPTRKRRTRAT